MGAALDNLRELLKRRGLSLDKRSFTSLLVLILMLVLLPVGIYLLKNRTVFMPMAAGELIQLADGGCIKLDKDKKKVVDCPTIPLKLVNPFYSVRGSSGAPSASVGSSAQPSSSAAGSTAPSPSASTIAPQIVRVSGNTSAEIQAALDQIKNSGGAVYVPAGSYAINSKIVLYSNTTLFGDGIDQTIFNAGTDIDAEEALIGNDTDEGNSNVVIRDMTLRAHALGSGEGIKLRNLTGGFVINVKVERTNTGILLGFHNGKGVNNVRISGCQMISTVNHGVFVTLGENNVIDNCSNNGNGSDSLGIGLEIAVDGKISNNRIIGNTVSNGGHSMSLTAGNDNQYQSGWVNSNNIVCYNNGSGNKIQPIWDQRGSSNVYVANGLGVVNVNSFGYEEKGGTDSRCDIPAAYNLPAVPTKPAADASNSFWGKLVGEVFAQDSDDNFTGTTYNDSDDNFTNSPAPAGSAGSGTGMVKYRLAESQAGLTSAPYKDFALIPFNKNLASNRVWIIEDANAQDSDDQFTSGSASPTPAGTAGTTGPGSSGNPSFSVGKQFINVNYQLSNSTPGAKQIWVQYLHPDGSTRVDHVTFNFVDKLPAIKGLSCNLDISKQNLQIKVSGNYFGDTIGKLSAESGGTPEVQSWNNQQISSSIKSSGSKEGQKYKIKVIRSDGFESGYAVCIVDKSLVSLGARLFCREPGKFDASDVAVTLIYADEANNNATKKVEEKVTINKDGEITNLKTQLQVGKNYAISIKAPNSLRRVTTFTASEGTSQITRPDGTPFILPIGDIAPVILIDGQINTLDRAELIRQWRVLSKDNTKITGDFNKDGRVNSIDWACMQYDFGAADDPLPVEVPQPASGTITIPAGSPGSGSNPGIGSGTITIPVRSPSPSPSPSVSTDAGSAILKDEMFS